MNTITAFKPEASSPRALVVFSGQTDLAWLRVLKRGFRHCFVLIECAPVHGDEKGGGWVLYNPLSNATQIAMWPLQDEESIQNWLMDQGYLVIKTYVRPLTNQILPWRPFTCVEAVKRALGLRLQGIFTPWQLYKFLIKDKKMKIILDISDDRGY